MKLTEEGKKAKQNKKRKKEEEKDKNNGIGLIKWLWVNVAIVGFLNVVSPSLSYLLDPQIFWQEVMWSPHKILYWNSVARASDELLWVCVCVCRRACTCNVTGLPCSVIRNDSNRLQFLAVPPTPLYLPPSSNTLREGEERSWVIQYNFCYTCQPVVHWPRGLVNCRSWNWPQVCISFRSARSILQNLFILSGRQNSDGNSVGLLPSTPLETVCHLH